MKEENITWIDPLRAITTFTVILVHVAADAVTKFNSIPLLDWWIANTYDSFCRFCVPIFLMISGTLILSKTYDNVGEYLKKRVLRILLPFLFYSLLYIILNLSLRMNQGTSFDPLEILIFILQQLKNGASFHLWYIYLILGLYLFFPIISRWLHQSNKHEIKYFLGLWFLTILVQFPLIKNILPKIELMYFSGYLGFPILGYYLSKTTYNFSQRTLTYLLIFLAGVAATAFGTYYGSLSLGSIDRSFYA